MINGTAMHVNEAEGAALVKAQRINIVIGGNDPQARVPVLHRQLLDRLDQGGPCPVPLPGSMKSQDPALLPVPLRHIGILLLDLFCFGLAALTTGSIHLGETSPSQ